MRNLVVGVIGHVDHGKTALVRALTGTDTDRLPEEKRRGISIALGFAHMTLGDVVVDLIDMPGHENFVRTMVAGATGIDVALVVVAATEGVMPQTVEHLAIAGLLGVTRAIVAVSFSDLAEPGPAGLATEAAARAAGLDVLAVVATSGRTGYGVADLGTAIAQLDSRPPKLLAQGAAGAIGFDERGFAWLPIDRAFSVAGHGTVVTGTLRHGSVSASSPLRLLPSGATVRVRAIQVRGARVAEARAGQRVAVNLRGVEPGVVGRGAALTTDDTIVPARLLTVRLSVLDDAPEAITTRTDLRLLIGTIEVGARLRSLDRTTAVPGSIFVAQMECAAAIAVPSRTRFVLRTASPARTVGGGIVLDANARRARRGDAPLAVDDDLPAAVAREALRAGEAGVSVTRLSEIVGRSATRVMAMIAAETGLTTVGRIAIERAALASLTEALRSAVSENGLVVEAWRRARRPVPAPDVVNAAIDTLLRGGSLRRVGGHLMPVRDSAADRAARQATLVNGLMDRVRAGGLTPPDVAMLTAADPRAGAALQVLLRAGILVRTTDRALKRDILFHRDAVAEARARLAPLLAPPGLSVSEAGAALGITRKFSVPLLEHLDAVRFTARVGDRRTLARGTD